MATVPSTPPILTLSILLMTALLVVPTAAAAGPGDGCSDRYFEASAGPVTVISRDSCSYEVTIDPDWRPPISVTDAQAPTGVAIPDADCYRWYWEIPVGPVKVVSRDSCSYSVEENEAWTPGELIATGDAGPDCMPRYWEQDVGPYTIVSRSSCQYAIEENEDWTGPNPGGPEDIITPG